MPVPAANGFKQIDGNDLEMSCRPAEDIQAAVSGMDGAVVLVHHMDLMTVEKLREIKDFMATKAEIPWLWAILKHKGESEFKISCIDCGQKIWVPDGRSGATARCPKCKKSFEIPTREQFLQLMLGIDDASKTALVEEGDSESFENVLKSLVGTNANKDGKPSKSGSKIRVRKKTS